MLDGRALLLVLASYLLGCFVTGYYLVRWRTGEDVRRTGSGSAGASNVSRILGAGGFAATLLDSCMGCAVHTAVERGSGYTTLELKVNLVKAITDRTGPVTAEGRLLHAGRRTATAEGKLVDARGNLLAHGTTTCLLLRFE